jgi:hypothetical protein
MSKAILVLDMPTDCEDCPLFKDGDKGMRECKASRKGTEWDYYKVRPNWCPLCEVPEKKEPPKYVYLTETEIREIGEAKGYNKCIDEILK